MTRAEAAEYIHAHGLFVSAGPVVSKSRGVDRKSQSWAVARNSSGDPRGCGPTLEAALADMLKRENLGDLL